MSLTVRDLEIGFNLYLMGLPNSSDGAVPIPLDVQGRKFAKYIANFGTGLQVAVKSVSLGPGVTDSDQDLNSIADIVSGTNIGFSKIVAIIVVNTTEDPTALLYADAGATNGWTVPYSGWRCSAFGLNSKGESVPGIIFNHNTNSSFQWPVTNGATDTINMNTNTPATATTITGRLIIIGYP